MLLGIWPAIGFAQTYYTIDTVNWWLCKVNMMTGAATYVAYMGSPAKNVEALTTNGNQLIALSHFDAIYNYFYSLMSIGTSGPQTGQTAITNWVYLNYPTDKIGGFDWTGSAYLFSWGTGPNAYFIGTYNASTNFVTGNAAIGPPDVDAYGYFGGRSWAVDNQPSVGNYLYSAPLAPLPFVGGDSFDALGHGNPTDLADFSTIEFGAIAQSGKAVMRISKSLGVRTALLPITGAPSNAVFKGLAVMNRTNKVPIETRRN